MTQLKLDSCSIKVSATLPCCNASELQGKPRGQPALLWPAWKAKPEARPGLSFNLCHQKKGVKHKGCKSSLLRWGKAPKLHGETIYHEINSECNLLISVGRKAVLQHHQQLRSSHGWTLSRNNHLLLTKSNSLPLGKWQLLSSALGAGW